MKLVVLLIFTAISVSVLITYKQHAHRDALAWNGDTEKIEKRLRILYLIATSAGTILGILGLLGYVKVRD